MPKVDELLIRVFFILSSMWRSQLLLANLTGRVPFLEAKYKHDFARDRQNHGLAMMR